MQAIDHTFLLMLICSIVILTKMPEYIDNKPALKTVLAFMGIGIADFAVIILFFCTDLLLTHVIGLTSLAELLLLISTGLWLIGFALALTALAVISLHQRKMLKA